MDTARSWTRAIASTIAMLMMLLALGAAPTAGAATVPTNGTFTDELAPWTTSTSCTLCTATVSHDGVDDSAQTTVDALVSLELLGELTTGGASWTSASFTRPAAEPEEAELGIRYAVAGTAIGPWSGAASVTVTLVNETAGTTHPLLTRTGLGLSGFTSATATVDPQLLDTAGTYRLRVDVGTSAAIALGLSTTVRFDDVALDITDAPAPPPTAPSVTNAATMGGATAGSVVVGADIAPHGADTTWWLEWGTTAALGQTVAGGVLPAAAAATRATATFGSVPAGTTIHWRFVAENAQGRTNGAAASYTAPGTTTGGSSGSGGGGATAQGGTPVKTSGGVTCTIVGTAKADRIIGTSKRDVICGLGGNDQIDGRGGNDVIDGGAGNDTILGSAGQDWIDGRAGADRIDGGAGSDVIDGGAGNDLLVGSGGRDRLMGNAGRDTLAGGAGRDILIGGAGIDRLIDTARGNVLRS